MERRGDEHEWKQEADSAVHFGGLAEEYGHAI
jgi:hypothetical protein